MSRERAALYGRLWRQHRLALLIMAIGLGLFEFVITRVAPDPGELGFLAQMSAFLPQPIVAMMGGELSLASARGVLAFGYIHPFFLTLLGAWTIRVSAASLAGEIGRGTMDLLASRPVPRVQLVVSTWLTIAAGLAVLILAAWTGSVVGLRLRLLDVSPRALLSVAMMAWLLFASWAAIGVLISATRRDAGPAIAWSSGVIVVSFVVDFLARAWAPAAWSGPFSLFAYYRPPSIVMAGVATGDIVRLTVVMLIALGGALVVFRRRDL